MADNKYRLPDDSANTGVFLDLSTRTVGGVTVCEERHVIVDNVANNYLGIASDGSILSSIWDGSNILGTSLHPVRTDPTGSTVQPVNGTVTANIGSAGTLALDTSLTSGNGKIQIYDGTQVIFVAAHPGYVQFNTAQHVVVDSGAITVSGTVTSNDILTPQTSGGTSNYRKISLASNNADTIKNAAGQLYGVNVFNNAGYPIFVKIYNKASAPAPGTDNALLVKVFGVQAGMSFTWFNEFGVPCGTGIAIAVVKLISDTDNTSIAAGDCVYDVDFK